MIRLLKKAIEDILSNKFLNALTVVTIALSILIVSAFGLLLMNVGDLINRWQTGVRIMVYLKDTWPADRQVQLEADLLHLEGVSNVRFISKKIRADISQTTDENPVFHLLGPKRKSPARCI